jgi:hypothetical protein
MKAKTNKEGNTTIEMTKDEVSAVYLLLCKTLDRQDEGEELLTDEEYSVLAKLLNLM